MSEFARGGDSNGGEGSNGRGGGRGGGRDTTGGGGGGGGRRDSNRAGTTASGSDAPLSSGTGENFSVISEVSSGGLPAPPVLPSGPLPAIGTIREVRQAVPPYSSRVVLR